MCSLATLSQDMINELYHNPYLICVVNNLFYGQNGTNSSRYYTQWHWLADELCTHSLCKHNVNRFCLYRSCSDFVYCIVISGWIDREIHVHKTKIRNFWEFPRIYFVSLICQLCQIFESEILGKFYAIKTDIWMTFYDWWKKFGFTIRLQIVDVPYVPHHSKNAYSESSNNIRTWNSIFVLKERIVNHQRK